MYEYIENLTAEILKYKGTLIQKEAKLRKYKKIEEKKNMMVRSIRAIFSEFKENLLFNDIFSTVQIESKQVRK